MSPNYLHSAKLIEWAALKYLSKLPYGYNRVFHWAYASSARGLGLDPCVIPKT